MAVDAPPAGDRRRADRRNNDRRQRAEPGTQWPARADEQAAVFDRGPAGSPNAAPGGDDAHARVVRTYLAARAAVGFGLVAAQAALALLGQRSSAAVLTVCLAYAVQALSLWLLPRYEPLLQAQPQTPRAAALRRRQWLATIGIDLLAFGTLHLLQLSASFNFAALLVLPVLMAGVATPRLPALATAAGVTLMLLVSGWQGTLTGGDSTVVLMQSGLAGLGLFVIALLAGELAARLARETQSARGSLELARQQALLNRMVIEEMADGVLVVDSDRQVRAANPAARALLVSQGLSPPAPFSLGDQAAWAELVSAVTQGLRDDSHAEWPEAGRDITLTFDGGQLRRLRLRGRFVRGAPAIAPGDATPGLAVLLLEDVRTAQARLRQEKLAAMGRVSVGIAHEIRNPLAAIAQANALLQEDLAGATHQRLLNIVAENVARLKRLVDDVMEVAPGSAPSWRVIDASREVASASADWAATVGLPLGGAGRLRAQLPGTPLGVVFDAEHLRRVLVNLLDNAHRHARQRPAAIELVVTARDEFSVQIAVRSDSPPITADVERYLFEPFFSTRSRGSGLGLYICRELCERYGASIEYRSRGAADAWPNEFVVTLRRAPLSEGEMALPLES
jgi:two-component system, NtrC family, sensor histidine kinase PilS